MSAWLAAFKTAYLNLDLENERRKKIPALALTVKQQSPALMEAYRSRDQSEPDGELRPFRISDIPEQREIEQIIEAQTAAQAQVAILRAELSSTLPLGVERQAARLVKELREHWSTASNEDLMRATALIDTLPRQPAEKRKLGRPNEISSDRKATALAQKDAGASNRKCAEILYETTDPTDRQVKNVPSILRYYCKTLSAINTRMVTPKDFVRAGRAVALTPGGQRGFFQAYEARMDTLVTHPIFGYQVSYRRLLEVQARLLAKVLEGELDEYAVFVTR